MTVEPPVAIAPDAADLDLLSRGEHHNPHSVLGAHPHPDGTVIRALRPHAEAVDAVIGGTSFSLEHLAHGVWGHSSRTGI